MDIPLWLLADDQMGKREFWSRCRDRVDHHGETLFSLSLDDCFDKNWKIQENNSKNAQDLWHEIEAFVGLDSVFGEEDEEDGHDRMAEGSAFSSSHYTLPTSFQDAYSNPRADHVVAQITLKEDAGEAYKDESIFDLIIKASEDNLQMKCSLKGKEDAETAAVKSAKFVLFNLACSSEFKTTSDGDQSSKANADNHVGAIKSVRQVCLADLSCEDAFHGASKERKDIENAVVKSRKHVKFDLPCKGDDERALKKHRSLTSAAERKTRTKKMQRLPKLNPQSMSALTQLAKLIVEVQQRKEGSSSPSVEETKATENDSLLEVA